ncbi:hypothetical protein ACOSQ4_007490 [Xanthoceras sorbifolium]
MGARIFDGGGGWPSIGETIPPGRFPLITSGKTSSTISLVVCPDLVETFRVDDVGTGPRVAAAGIARRYRSGLDALSYIPYSVSLEVAAKSLEPWSHSLIACLIKPHCE